MTVLQKHLVFVPLFCVAFVGVFGLAVMLLWNWLMPELFGLQAISFWQAAGLLVLCKVLFGGLGGHHHGHGCHHGIWSAMQTVGLNNKVWFSRLKTLSVVYSTILILAFAAVAVLFCLGYTPHDIHEVMP